MFKYKTYRVEHVARIIWVDYQGVQAPGSKPVWERIFSTYENALIALSDRAMYNQSKMCWETGVPNQIGEIITRETLMSEV